MSDLYWITVLGNLSLLGALVFALSSCVVIGLIIVFYNSEDLSVLNNIKKVIKRTVPIFIISLLITLFIPSTKELYVIYGIGSTLDYLKKNPTAQDLPNKYIKLLDKVVDNLIEENNKNERNKN